jgi:hypothetical protein
VAPKRSVSPKAGEVKLGKDANRASPAELVGEGEEFSRRLLTEAN